jgi:hypothetical protein
MGGWMDGWMDGWTDRETDRQKERKDRIILRRYQSRQNIVIVGR